MKLRAHCTVIDRAWVQALARGLHACLSVPRAVLSEVWKLESGPSIIVCTVRCRSIIIYSYMYCTRHVRRARLAFLLSAAMQSACICLSVVSGPPRSYRSEYGKMVKLMVRIYLTCIGQIACFNFLRRATKIHDRENVETIFCFVVIENAKARSREMSVQ